MGQDNENEIDVTSADWSAGYEAGLNAHLVTNDEPDADFDPDTLSEDERVFYDLGYDDGYVDATDEETEKDQYGHGYDEGWDDGYEAGVADEKENH
jgi:hypothetical protein